MPKTLQLCLIIRDTDDRYFHRSFNSGVEPAMSGSVIHSLQKCHDEIIQKLVEAEQSAQDVLSALASNPEYQPRA